MAKTSMKVKQQRKQKYSTREYNRCRIENTLGPAAAYYGRIRIKREPVEE